MREIILESNLFDFNKPSLFVLVEMPGQLFHPRNEVVRLTKECDRTVCRAKIKIFLANGNIAFQ